MSYTKTNYTRMEKASGDSSFPNLLENKEDNVLRDSYILLNSENADTEDLTAGFTAVYPGCSTGGHSHSEFEEIYFITKGKGVAQVGEEKFEIEAGDCFHIPCGPYHRVFNNSNETLEYNWVLNARE